MSEKDSSFNVLDLFQDKNLVKICAPMVRYSKLQFRNLVKLYGCDLTFTPMILADSFCLSDKARKNEFTTNTLDTPLITQFAANTVHDFVGAAHMVSPYCNGVDLNCGCPQRWAKALGLGCSMLKEPQLIYDIVRQCRNQILKPFTVSVKMRLCSDVKETVNVCKQLEMCGVSFINVHARTASQIIGDINVEVLKLIKENCHVPIVGNGGVTSLDKCVKLQDHTGCDGVMVANSILLNPTIFTGSSVTTMDCVQNWLDICYNSTLTDDEYHKELKDQWLIPEKPHNLTFQCFHHHLVFMLEKILTRPEKQIFNNLKKFSAVLEFIRNKFNIQPQLYDYDRFLRSLAIDINYFGTDMVYKSLKPPHFNIKNGNIKYSCDESDGKYFSSKVNLLEDSDSCDWASMFLEND